MCHHKSINMWGKDFWNKMELANGVNKMENLEDLVICLMCAL